MASPAEVYADGIKRKLRDYFATWLPWNQVDLGDVGTLDGNFFSPITDLKDLRINIDFKKDRVPAPLDIQSESGVSTAFKVAGEVNPMMPNVPKADLGVAIEFSHAGAFIFQAPEIFDPPYRRDIGVAGPIKTSLR